MFEFILKALVKNLYEFFADKVIKQNSKVFKKNAKDIIRFHIAQHLCKHDKVVDIGEDAKVHNLVIKTNLAKMKEHIFARGQYDETE